jgi:hypothetical protein
MVTDPSIRFVRMSRTMWDQLPPEVKIEAEGTRWLVHPAYPGHRTRVELKAEDAPAHSEAAGAGG